jgi:hypothetical protein
MVGFTPGAGGRAIERDLAGDLLAGATPAAMP